jgi:hypothetical protein
LPNGPPRNRWINQRREYILSIILPPYGELLAKGKRMTVVMPSDQTAGDTCDSKNGTHSA